MSDSKIPTRRPPAPPPAARGRTWEPIEPPPPGPPDAVIIPEGQLADILSEELAEAMEEEGPGVLLDPRWRAARDAFLASMDKEWGRFVLEELGRQIARQKDGAKESAKDLHQKVRLVLCRRYTEHVARTGEAWAPDNPEAYLRTVSQNVARDHFKVKARKPAIARGVEVEKAAGADPDSDPEEAMGHAELLAIFERERERLPPDEADVFQGRASLGMTFRAIAAVLRRPLSTVKDEYARAVARLQAILATASGKPPAGDTGDARDACRRRR